MVRVNNLGKFASSVGVRRFWQYIAFFLLVHFQCISAFSTNYHQFCHHNSRRKDILKIKQSFPFHILATSDSNSSQEKRRQSLVVGNDPLLSLNMNLDALARAQAAERAQELYQRIAALHREGYYAVSPDVVSFNSVIKAWQSDPSRALEFWEQEVDQLSRKDKPNTRSFNTFLLSLANAGLYKSAEELLEQMKNCESVVVPDRITYNTVLLSYLLSAEGSIAADRAEKLLKEMLSGENDLSLASIHYCRPDIISFNTVIATWANHPNPEVAVAKAEEWLPFVKNYPGVKPDIYTYTTVLHAWARYGRTRRKKLRTSTEPKATFDDSVARIREIFQEIDDAGLVPNRVTYTVAMQELALNANGGPETARELLREMLAKGDAHPEARPDVVTFSVLIDAYSDLASEFPEESVQSCINTLSEMKQLAKKWPDVAPNERTYTSMISVLAQSRTREAGPLAEKLLQDMWNTPELTPSVIHYNACINVYAKSSRADKAMRAERVWQDMKEKGIAEDTITYNSLLAATSGVFGSPNLKTLGLKLGIKVFQNLQENPECIPNTLSYYYWFKTIRRLMGHSHPLRDAVIRQAFDLCCQQGCLNDTLLQYLMTHFESMGTLLKRSIQAEGKQGQNGSYSTKHLPREWSKNALESRFSVER
jgi:pentatricopeptide repeat protein